MRKSFISLLLAVSISGAFTGVSLAAEVSEELHAKMNATVSKMSHGTLFISETFPGPDGLIGLRLKPTVESPEFPPAAVAWATPSGEYLISGTLLDSSLVDHSEQARNAFIERDKAPSQLDVAAPAVDGAKVLPAEAINILDQIQGVPLNEPQGDAETLLVLFDPRCPHCRKLYDLLTDKGVAADMDRVGVETLFAPVNILEKGSDRLGAFILESGRSGVSLVESGAVNAQSPISPTAGSLDQVELNTQSMLKLFDPGVPVSIWMDKQGVLRYLAGELTVKQVADIVNNIKGGAQ